MILKYNVASRTLAWLSATSSKSVWRSQHSYDDKDHKGNTNPSVLGGNMASLPNHMKALDKFNKQHRYNLQGFFFERQTNYTSILKKTCPKSLEAIIIHPMLCWIGYFRWTLPETARLRSPDPRKTILSWPSEKMQKYVDVAWPNVPSTLTPRKKLAAITLGEVMQFFLGSGTSKCGERNALKDRLLLTIHDNTCPYSQHEWGSHIGQKS